MLVVDEYNGQIFILNFTLQPEQYLHEKFRKLIKRLPLELEQDSVWVSIKFARVCEERRRDALRSSNDRNESLGTQREKRRL